MVSKKIGRNWPDQTNSIFDKIIYEGEQGEEQEVYGEKFCRYLSLNEGPERLRENITTRKNS